MKGILDLVKAVWKHKKARYISLAVIAAVAVTVTTVCCLLCIDWGNGIGTVYAEENYGFQLEKPREGDTVAIIHTSKGDVHVRLFPEAAPKAVENFITLASNGYYDGTLFHYVFNEYLIQGGDPNGDGTGGESIFTDTPDKSFQDEFDQKLLNLRGALAMANGGPDTNRSQFFINQTSAEGFGKRESYTEENVDLMYKTTYEQYAIFYGDSFVEHYKDWEAFKQAEHEETYIYEWVPEEVWALYETYGGTISNDGAWRRSGGYTVFGQVYKGMNVVDSIAKVEVDADKKPVKDVVVKSIEITTYKSSK